MISANVTYPASGKATVHKSLDSNKRITNGNAVCREGTVALWK